MLVVIEDIHWADPALLELLEELPSELESATTLLCLCRRELFEQHTSWGGGAGYRTVIELTPLSDDESAGLTSHLLGMEAPREVVDVVRRRAEGNPFFAAELLRMLTEDGSLASERRPLDARGDAARGTPRHRPGRDRSPHRPNHCRTLFCRSDSKMRSDSQPSSTASSPERARRYRTSRTCCRWPLWCLNTAAMKFRELIL